MDQPSPKLNKLIAVVSGKGGSGKTLIVSTMGQVFDKNGVPVTLVDTDIATGGLSYYLGIKYFSGIGNGVCDLLLLSAKEGSAEDVNSTLPSVPESTGLSESPLPIGNIYIKSLRGSTKAKIISIGNQRKIERAKESQIFKRNIGRVLKSAALSTDSALIIDCRGGIDEDSVAVCRAVDHIVIVAETDPSSFQATRHLAEVLVDEGLENKILGFIVNRVFDDPTVLIRNVITEFRGSFMGAIPFDLEAIRNFHVGEKPDLDSLFGIHVWNALHSAFPEQVAAAPGRVWEHGDFQYATLTDRSSLMGGALIASAVIAVTVIATPYFIDVFSQLNNTNNLADPYRFRLLLQERVYPDLERLPTIADQAQLNSWAKSLKAEIDQIYAQFLQQSSAQEIYSQRFVGDARIFILYGLGMSILALFACIGFFRRIIGRVAMTYLRVFSRVLTIGRHWG